MGTKQNETADLLLVKPLLSTTQVGGRNMEARPVFTGPQDLQTDTLGGWAWAARGSRLLRRILECASLGEKKFV